MSTPSEDERDIVTLAGARHRGAADRAQPHQLNERS
jgi:hypothetical protein